MKKKILAGILSFVMLVAYVFVGSACDEKKRIRTNKCRDGTIGG